jgi:hypothetical protein
MRWAAPLAVVLLWAIGMASFVSIGSGDEPGARLFVVVPGVFGLVGATSAATYLRWSAAGRPPLDTTC